MYVRQAGTYVYMYVSPAPGRSSKLTHTAVEIVPFHKDFSPSSEQLEHRKLAHGL